MGCILRRPHGIRNGVSYILNNRLCNRESKVLNKRSVALLGQCLLGSEVVPSK